jgi:hypothetical protein
MYPFASRRFKAALFPLPQDTPVLGSQLSLLSVPGSMPVVPSPQPVRRISLNPVRRRKTLPGSDHLHRIDRGKQILFFETRGEFHRQQLLHACKMTVITSLVAFVLLGSRRRLWWVISGAAGLYHRIFLS